MKTIKNGIVFSNDIERIIKGYNALSFDFKKSGMMIPSCNFINGLREDFKEDVNKIFSNVTIISEDEMYDGLYESILDIYGSFPHCIFG